MITGCNQITDYLSSLKHFLHKRLPNVVKGMKSVNTTGQVIFIMEQAKSYFKFYNPYVMVPVTAVTAANSVAVVGICKFLAIERTFSPPAENTLPVVTVTQEQEIVLSGYKKAVYFFLSGASLLSGIFDGMYGFMGANIVMELLTRQLPLNEITADVVVTLFSIAGFGVSFACYLAYDYWTVLDVNAKTIANSFSFTQLPRNSALLKTVVVGAPIIFDMSSQAYLSTVPALRTLPVVGRLLTPAIARLSSQAVSLIAGITVLNAFPSIYNYFIEPPTEAATEQPESNLTTACRYATYTTGTVDCLLNVGLGVFLAIIAATHDEMGVNPYGWIIGIAILGGLYAAILNAATAIRPGYLERMDSLRQEQQPEPIEIVIHEPETNSPVSSGIYRSANRIGLLFKTACDGMKQAILPAANPESGQGIAPG
ncbi:hypothetical protein ACFORL_09150 [Legionella dresdenensis]|uniref:Uncharacterized protein n=1 Tax=Legionella dresdenensis TaxID=450200 RepID=A0ABV8CGL6_9GAMM